ncbi:Cleavage factor two protein 1 [Purpureocillium lavendulum]|uniref:Cleavage factor two protein 1 n=1 Tax=Purpureocillium lavendulum TaxID=1247861 RepID=A0AB34FT07_9HYPO|nr:Cleavage factor two protein 1 [Purpureocillium lavendulum]
MASRQEPRYDGMDAANDPRAVDRAPVSMEAGPSRCHMESSFLNILHSTGFAEWAARAEAQNQQLGVTQWPAEREAGTSSSSDGKSRKSSASSRSSTKSSSAKKGSRSRKPKDGEGKGKSRASRSSSKRTEESVEEDEEMDAAETYERDNFVPHYANYNNMDAELNILKRHLMQRGALS